ncbi:MAG: MBL fold metallo-hydrolase, partial [Halobacteriales archaeon]
IHIMHGPGEAWAHLDHLERLGLVVEDDSGYRLQDASADPETLELS